MPADPHFPFVAGAFGAVLAGHFDEPDTYETRRPHGMKDWLIVYTLGGEGYFLTPAGKRLCGEGDVALLRSGVPHQYGTSPGRRWHFYWAHFTDLPETGYLPGEEDVIVQPAASERVRERIEHTFEKILLESRERSGLWQALCENAIREVLLLITRLRQHPVDPRIEQIQQLLTRRMKEPVRIDELAKEVGLSASRLSHLFKAETGESVIEALNRMRVRQAALLIRHIGRTATEAAHDVGFQNYNHFAALFRKQLGVSPREYKRRLEEEAGGK